jgi:hypothetical protein
MLDWHNALMSEKERRRQQMAKVEEHRLVQEALKHQATYTKGRRPLLARLGMLLVDWGYRLQARYETLDLSPGGLGQESLLPSSQPKPHSCSSC